MSSEHDLDKTEQYNDFKEKEINENNIDIGDKLIFKYNNNIYTGTVKYISDETFASSSGGADNRSSIDLTSIVIVIDKYDNNFDNDKNSNNYIFLNEKDFILNPKEIIIKSNDTPFKNSIIFNFDTGSCIKVKKIKHDNMFKNKYKDNGKTGNIVTENIVVNNKLRLKFEPNKQNYDGIVTKVRKNDSNQIVLNINIKNNFNKDTNEYNDEKETINSFTNKNIKFLNGKNFTIIPSNITIINVNDKHYKSKYNTIMEVTFENDNIQISVKDEKEEQKKEGGKKRSKTNRRKTRSKTRKKHRKHSSKKRNR